MRRILRFSFCPQRAHIRPLVVPGNRDDRLLLAKYADQRNAGVDSAIGDSWFWYPKVSNLLAEVSAVVRPDYSNIMALGYLGAKLDDYINVNGRYAADFARELRRNFVRYYSAVMISGGGNDAVDWGLGLKDDCSRETTAAGCLDEARLRGS